MTEYTFLTPEEAESIIVAPDFDIKELPGVLKAVHSKGFQDGWDGAAWEFYNEW